MSNLSDLYAHFEDLVELNFESILLELIDLGVVRISLTASKEVLSYYDNDTVDLYAQLVDGANNPLQTQGVNITFKNGENILGTVATDNTGKATLSNAYASQGNGIVQFSAEKDDYTASLIIEDCLRYGAYYSASTDLNWSLPSEFELEFTINVPKDSMACLIMDNGGTVNQLGKNNSYGTVVRFNGDYMMDIPYNTDLTYTLQCKNGVATFTNGHTAVSANRTYSLIQRVTATKGAYVKNIKIKEI